MNSYDWDPGAAGSNLHRIAHYYGDPVRWLFLGAAALWFVSLPLFPGVLPTDAALQVAAGVLLVIFAALTNPHKRWIIVGDSIIAGLGLIVFETIAIDQFSTSSWTLFILREALALMFLTALYFSLKTVRAMMLHQIGKEGTRFGEFLDGEEEQP
jgi:hypothetical protein